MKPLWSAGTVINIKELWAVLQVYQCSTRSFITPIHLKIHPWQDSALSELTSAHLHQLQHFPSSLSPTPKHTPFLAVTNSTVQLPETAVPKAPKLIFSSKQYPLKQARQNTFCFLHMQPLEFHPKPNRLCFLLLMT